MQKPQQENHLRVVRLITEDLQGITTEPLTQFELIREKSGVYVYRCLYGGVPAVVKYFENESDRREILNYQILQRHGIPTIQTFAFGKASLVMEDILSSAIWRLGEAPDLKDATVASNLARWYFTFHENGANVPELDNLYFEYDWITKANLLKLADKLPETTALCQFLVAQYEKLHALIYKPMFTLTYNDFYWVNFVVRKDSTAAMMFDYNLLGKGYRFSDFRNVCSSLSGPAGDAFRAEYEGLYLAKHGHSRSQAEKLEQDIDEVLSPLFSLMVACFDREHFPDWALEEKQKAEDGSLLAKAKELL